MFFFLEKKVHNFLGLILIDLALISPNLEAKITRRFTDDEVELFTGAPRRGHIPVLNTIDMQPPRKFFRKNTIYQL